MGILVEMGIISTSAGGFIAVAMYFNESIHLKERLIFKLLC